MFRLRRLRLAPVLFLAASVAAASSDGQPTWSWTSDDGARHVAFAPFDDEWLAAALGLRQDQQEAVSALSDEMALAAAPLKETLRQQREALRAMLDAGVTDATALGEQVLEIHATRQQLEALHEDFREQVSGLLDDEQLARFQEIRREFEAIPLEPGLLEPPAGARMLVPLP